jgi:hypothetical protein
MNKQISRLQKTGWGKVAFELVAAQIKTGGPLGELITAFKNLVKDLNFKLQSEHRDYVLAKSEHFSTEKECNEHITRSKFEKTVAAQHLTRTLLPEKMRLGKIFHTAQRLHARTKNSLQTSTSERSSAATKYRKFCENYEDTYQAIKECQALVRKFRAGKSKQIIASRSKSFAKIPNKPKALIQASEITENLAQISEKLTHLNPLGDLAKALVQLTQDFANKESTRKVAVLLAKLLENLQASKDEADQNEKEDIALFLELQRSGEETAAKAKNTMTETKREQVMNDAAIFTQTKAKGEAEGSFLTWTKTLNEETKRWESFVDAYKDIIAQIKEEVDAIDKIVELFSNQDASDELLDRLNQLQLSSKQGGFPTLG